jgi:hypothetical protein
MSETSCEIEILFFSNGKVVLGFDKKSQTSLLAVQDSFVKHLLFDRNLLGLILDFNNQRVCVSSLNWPNAKPKNESYINFHHSTYVQNINNHIGHNSHIRYCRQLNLQDPQRRTKTSQGGLGPCYFRARYRPAGVRTGFWK